MADEQNDFEDEYGGDQKLEHHGSGAIPALVDEEMGEDDEYDDLYSDVNVGENFKLVRQSDPPPDHPGGNAEFHFQSLQARNESGNDATGSQNAVATDGENFSEQKKVAVVFQEQETRPVGFSDGSSAVKESAPVSNLAAESSDLSRIGTHEPVFVPNSVNAGSGGTLPISAGEINMNTETNFPMVNDYQVRPPVDNGSTMLFIGELHWWTTDAELESACSQYGRVKEVKFYDERASGKSKGYCQVEFYDSSAAAACKEGMNGCSFNGRECVVAFASPQTLKQMGASYMNKNQNQPLLPNQGRRPANVNGSYQGGETGRNYGRGNWPRGGQGGGSRVPGVGGSVRGRGAIGGKNMGGNASGIYAPAFGGNGLIPPHGMLGAGYGFTGPGFPGMVPSFPGVNAMGLGVAPHVNPAFFGRGMAANGMGMMGSSAMEAPNSGMWPEMGSWGEDHGRRTTESSYGADDGASEYGYGEINHEKGGRSGGGSREKDRDWSGNSERNHRDEREQERDRTERDHRDHRYRDEKDNYREYRQRERDSDRGLSSSRSRNRSRGGPEGDVRSRSRDTDRGKRRREHSE